jgi:hypothetical protein
MESKEARWQRSADRAISSTKYEGQRKDLARCLAGRLLNPRMPLKPSTIVVIPSLDRERYENAISTILDDFQLRISLAARYLQLLHDSLRSADYEEAEELQAEAGWARAYFETLFECPIPVSPEWDRARSHSERRGRSLDDFLSTLESSIAPYLHSAARSIGIGGMA